jgi:hypothetical protein
MKRRGDGGEPSKSKAREPPQFLARQYTEPMKQKQQQQKKKKKKKKKKKAMEDDSYRKVSISWIAAKRMNESNGGEESQMEIETEMDAQTGWKESLGGGREQSRAEQSRQEEEEGFSV